MSYCGHASVAVLIAVIVSANGMYSWNPSSGSRCPRYSGRVFLANAQNTAGLEQAILKYRQALGGVDNENAPGPIERGHRIINWDAAAVPFNMPSDFFKNTVTRGAEFRTRGNLFAVSNPSLTGPNDNRFSSFDKRFPRLFTTFSPKRLFTGVLSNRIDTLFSVPAEGTKASVSGFGAIFTNVVLRGRTKITYFDKNNCPIVSVTAQTRPRGLSFVGVIVNRRNGALIRAAVASTRMTLGNGIIGKPQSPRNFVVADDLIYGEPQAIF